MAKRNPDGTFQKGSSGNPGGAPRALTAFRSKMRELSAEQVAAFIEDQITFKKRRTVDRVFSHDPETDDYILKSETVRETAGFGKFAMEAAKECNNRAWGKSTEHVEIDPAKLSDQRLLDEAADIIARRRERDREVVIENDMEH